MVSMRSSLVALLFSVTLENSLASNGASDTTALNFRRLNSTTNSTASDAHATAFLSSAATLTVIASMRGY